jgi:PPP family 3-phenylpropionic acid transporter
MRAAFLIGSSAAGIYAANGVYMAFFAILLSAKGLDSADISLIFGVTQIARVGAGALWGMLCDYLGRVRLVLAMACGLCCVAVLSVLGLAGFWPIFAAVLLFNIGVSTLMPLFDVLTLSAARTMHFNFGRVRASGSAAFMVAALGAGFVVAALGAGSIVWMMVLCYALTLLLLPMVPEARALVAGGSVRDARGLHPLRIRAFRLMLACCALIQGAHAAYYALSTLHWRAAGLSDQMIGLLWAEGVLAEITVLITCQSLVRRLGPANLITIGIIGSVVRWVGTALTTNAMVLAVLQPLHAVSFTLSYLAAIQVMTHCVPAQRAASAQSLNGAIGVAAPLGIAMFFSGLIYDRVGGHVFLVMAALAACGVVFIPALRRSVAWR